jgi:tetratricopeptide (TPR) repeat protein
VADIFVSYTSDDLEWAKWIAQELEKLGHSAHVDRREVPGGGDIMKWIQDQFDGVDHVLCVVSNAYLTNPHSSAEFRAAQWAVQSGRTNFALSVLIETCEMPLLFARFSRRDLYGIPEEEARKQLADLLRSGSARMAPVPFPGARKATTIAPVAFPGGPRALSNIPISVPRYFLGRDEVLAKIKVALTSDKGRAAITALHGLRGVGKTTLAAAYAEQHRADYRATWWIRAENESTIRADLVGLGVRLGWVAVDEKEEPALVTVRERLRDEGEGILLIFDNAVDADSVESYFPSGGVSQVLVTSNSHAWRDVASPMQIDTWPETTGAKYLVSRTGREAEQEEALALSNVLGGLPLAHEQAAAYCERLEVPLATYQKRYEMAPVTLLGDPRDAPRSYHNRLTVAKTFALAIDEVAKLHTAAEPLIVHAALLAPEPIPLYLFSEARDQYDKQFASLLIDDGLDEAVAALRAFALIDRESIADERDPAIVTDCIRVHRLVSQIAAARRKDDALVDVKRGLVAAIAATYPRDVWNSPKTWPRARRLEAFATTLVDSVSKLPQGLEEKVADLLNEVAAYRHYALGLYSQALPLSERALAIRETVLGPEHAGTASSLHNLAARLREQGDAKGARPLFERALAIYEKVFGADDPRTTATLNQLGILLGEQGDYDEARSYLKRAFTIREKVLGPDHPTTASSLNNLGTLSRVEGDLASAQLYLEAALAIYQKVLGPDHLSTAASLANLGALLYEQGDFLGALPLFERAVAIRAKVFNPMHPTMQNSARGTAYVLEALGRTDEAAVVRDKYGIGD